MSKHGKDFSIENVRDDWKKHIDIKKRLAKAASELNDESIDWNNKNQLKWYIKFDCEAGELGSEIAKVYVNDSIYFTSRKAARKAIEIVGEKELICMLRDFQPFIGYSVKV